MAKPTQMKCGAIVFPKRLVFAVPENRLQWTNVPCEAKSAFPAVYGGICPTLCYRNTENAPRFAQGNGENIWQFLVSHVNLHKDWGFSKFGTVIFVV